MKTRILLNLLLLAALNFCIVAAQDIRLSPTCVMRFATVNQAVAVLGAEDEFTRRLSRFDLQSRLQSDAELTSADYRKAVIGGIQPWAEGLRSGVHSAAVRLAERLKDYQLPLPDEILLVCTTGDGEAGAPHTRGNAIVLPESRIGNRSDELVRLLAHELFHIMSRHAPTWRDRMYATIGFVPCDEVRLPIYLRDRRITNPDAPIVQHRIQVRINGNHVHVAPVLLAKIPQYDPRRPQPFFAFLDLQFLHLQQQSGRWSPELLDDGSIVSHRVGELENFMQQVGSNTKYLIHPEEILADNFSYLVSQRDVASPEILVRIQAILKP